MRIYYLHPLVFITFVEVCCHHIRRTASTSTSTSFSTSWGRRFSRAPLSHQLEVPIQDAITRVRHPISGSIFVKECRAVSKAKATSKGKGKDDVTKSAPRQLYFWENMICGATSRSLAQVMLHPLNTMKTIMQAERESLTFATLARPSNWNVLLRGAGAQFILSVPHGALNFAVLEYVRGKLDNTVQQKLFEATRKIKFFKERKVFSKPEAFGPGLDFLSSCISTISVSIVSTPQMMLTDNIMAGRYPNLPAAFRGISTQQGIRGFYKGWWPGLAGKIPSYALTWTLFQQLKKMQLDIMERPPTNLENSVMGCVAAATTVCVMIPMDTIKTRLVTQTAIQGVAPYRGICDAATRILREEGVGAFYRGLFPRLLSVVPMIGVQFGTYEYMKKVMLARTGDSFLVIKNRDEDKFGEVMMEVGADDEQPFPAPFHARQDKVKAANGHKK